MNPDLIQKSVPLADFVWFKTGGSAAWFAEPKTAAEFGAAIVWARSRSLDITVLGEGANVLIADEGIPGLTIRPRISSLEIVRDGEHAFVRAGAGVSIGSLIQFCFEHNLLGLEEFSGIPGTVGGSVYINIHYFRFLLSDFLVSATVVDAQTGEVQVVDAAWFAFGYNTSTLHSRSHYLVDATLAVRPASALEVAFARGRSQEMIRHRAQRYPNARTCGSFFRNFHSHEVSFESNGQKMIFIAYYLDAIGVKGRLSVGGAAVSYKHANMLVTSEGATSADVVALAREMQKRVFDAYGIVPVSECQFLGFPRYPLLSHDDCLPVARAQVVSL